MQDIKRNRKYYRSCNVENEFECDNIFKSDKSQPYLDSTQKGKWGRGKDDSPIDEDEYPRDNNPLPY